MHYHLEIIMPPSEDVSKAITTILLPFFENTENEFYFDWYIIGGRWSGVKGEPRNPNQYKNNVVFPDVVTLAQMPPDLTAHRVLIVDEDLQKQYMIAIERWNGFEPCDPEWDGKVASAIEAYRKDCLEPKYPQANWLVVTVDYHV